MPPGLEAALKAARWYADGGDDGWIVGDYAGHTASVDLSGLASFNDRGSYMTAVDPIDDVWHFYDVATDGRTTELLTLPAAYANVDATRSSDGTRLYFQGIEPGVDGGVDVVDLQTGARATVVRGGPTPGKSRRGLFWSTSGNTLFSGLCGFYVCRMDVIDGATGVARRLPKPFGAIAASDHYALGYESADGPDRPWAIYDLETDELTTVTKKWIATTEEGVSVGGDRFAVAGFTANHETYNIVLVNARTGTSRLVHSESSGDILVARLRRFLTGSRWVILSAGMPWDLLREGEGRADVLDIETGDVIRSVAVVGPST